MTFAGSLDDLEAQIEGQHVAIIKDYWRSKTAKQRVENHSPSIVFPAIRQDCLSASGSNTI
jgi:hypothetical protein